MRKIKWVKQARKAFEGFPEPVQDIVFDALGFASEGLKPASVKPLKGFTDGVFEIALKHRGNAWRVVYAVQIGDAIWVLHAFQKKSKIGIKTPKREIDLIRQRLHQIKEIES